ncbi:ASCH domain-containing protein [Georgenia faecalis]|uniref:ASCH domain-containing protein n=1 Tax=Georgenia faecalis TaxID=2483799 RepID=UPI000FD86875
MDDDAARPDAYDGDATQADGGPLDGEDLGRPAAAEGTDADQDAVIEAYWQLTRKRAGINRLDVIIGQAPLSNVVPPAWAFGGTPEEADALLDLVLAGNKTATTSAQWEYEEADAPLPAVGDLSIILDGSGRPRALIVTTAVDVVPFDAVDAEHARAEGEGSLEDWRAAHTRLFGDVARAVGRTLAEDMPVVLERFRLLDPKAPREDAPAPVAS